MNDFAVSQCASVPALLLLYFVVTRWDILALSASDASGGISGFWSQSMFGVVQLSNASRCTDVVDKSAGKPHVRADDVQQIHHTTIVLGLSGSAGSTCYKFSWHLVDRQI